MNPQNHPARQGPSAFHFTQDDAEAQGDGVTYQRGQRDLANKWQSLDLGTGLKSVALSPVHAASTKSF